mmetsp:Transcript_15237/g.50037  ORF Transcript_15237/g.50037 Transcript_15237/m.50037 type:complete len:127 (+) Transcript_15237:94-474(+)
MKITIKTPAAPTTLSVPSNPPFKALKRKERVGKKGVPRPKKLKQILAAEGYEKLSVDTPTYFAADAPPSSYPSKRWCDLTGLPAPYIDPKTKLRYANASAFRAIRRLPEDSISGLLQLRNALVTLK